MRAFHANTGKCRTNNKIHLIKSEKKIINLKQNYISNKPDLKTAKMPEKSNKLKAEFV